MTGGGWMAATGSGAIEQCGRVRADYVPVRVAGKLVFRYDPRRRIVEVQDRGERHYIDLAALDERAQPLDINVK
ncbi:hypothetical protein [Caldilinea sp.]|uniref:hypothetical protein n=1 Tax=Caldilinea sp. TaxID=2293560 RepID=UPI002B760534|nr:hypothetical protein [Caldilinea sp.]